MRRSSVLAFAVFMVALLGAAPARAALLGYWSFDDSQSTNAATDYSGRAVHGTLAGGPTYTMGQFGSAINLGTANNGRYVRVMQPGMHNGALASITANNAATVSLWVYGDASQPQSDTAFSFDNGAGSRQLQTHLPWGDRTIYWDVGGGSAGGVHRINKTENDAAKWRGQWNHYAFVKNGTDSKIYRNGQLWHSGTTSASIGQIVRGAIGARADGGESYGGLIDDFALFDVELTTGQIADLAGGALSPADFVTNEYYQRVMADQPFVYYQFDGDSGANGSTLWDSSGNGRNGTYQNGSTFLDPNQRLPYGGLAAHFSPSSERAAGTTEQPSTNSVSVEALVKSDTDLWNATGPLVSKRDAFILHPRAGESTLQFYVHVGGWQPIDYDPIADDPDFTLTDWHHYVGTFDGTTGDLSLFIDGDLKASRNLGTGQTITGSNNPLYIGFDAGGPNRYFDGLIDEVAMYDYALSPEQVWAHFAAVPEPGSAVLLLAALMAAAVRRRRRRRI